jgi:hypothetical protein
MHPGYALLHAGMHLVILGPTAWEFARDDDAAILGGYDHGRRGRRVDGRQRLHAQHRGTIRALAAFHGIPLMRRGTAGAYQGYGNPHYCRCPTSCFHALQTTCVACRFPLGRNCVSAVRQSRLAAPRAAASVRFCRKHRPLLPNGPPKVGFRHHVGPDGPARRDSLQKSPLSCRPFSHLASGRRL